MKIVFKNKVKNICTSMSLYMKSKSKFVGLMKELGWGLNMKGIVVSTITGVVGIVPSNLWW